MDVLACSKARGFCRLCVYVCVRVFTRNPPPRPRPRTCFCYPYERDSLVVAPATEERLPWCDWPHVIVARTIRRACRRRSTPLVESRIEDSTAYVFATIVDRDLAHACGNNGSADVARIERAIGSTSAASRLHSFCCVSATGDGTRIDVLLLKIEDYIANVIQRTLPTGTCACVLVVCCFAHAGFPGGTREYDGLAGFVPVAPRFFLMQAMGGRGGGTWGVCLYRFFNFSGLCVCRRSGVCR